MTTTSTPAALGPTSVIKAATGGSLTTLAWAVADLTRPDQVAALVASGVSDVALWLVPNDAEHPRWYRRAAKACVAAAGTGVAAGFLALGQWEGDGGDLSIHGVFLQLSTADWSTLGLLVARVGLVALLPNSRAEDATLEREASDVPAAPTADLSGAPIGEDEDGATITSTLPAVARTSTPADLLALQRQADATTLGGLRPRRSRDGRHEQASGASR